MKKLLILTILLISIGSANALQQTAGALNYNLTVGDITFQKYGIRNDENTSIVINFSIIGNISQYVEYPTGVEFAPHEFRYIPITVGIPSNYTGNTTLKGTIYVLKEGSKDGQVQLNIRLGKPIVANIIKPNPAPKASGFSSFMLISTLFAVYFMKKICFKT